MLNEHVLRRPEFVEGMPIKLADGQLWHFQLPTMELSPRFDNGEVTLGSSTNFGPEHNALIEAAQKAVGILEELKTTWAIAASLLRRNYTLSDADLASLLRYRRDEDGESQKVIEAILSVAFGNAVKPSAVGDA